MRFATSFTCSSISSATTVSTARLTLTSMKLLTRVSSSSASCLGSTPVVNRALRIFLRSFSSALSTSDLAISSAMSCVLLHNSCERIIPPPPPPPPLTAAVPAAA